MVISKNEVLEDTYSITASGDEWLAIYRSMEQVLGYNGRKVDNSISTARTFLALIQRHIARS